MALPQLEERLYTVDEFEEIADSTAYAGFHLELVNGVIVEKAMPTEEHGNITGNFYDAFRGFVYPRKLGRVVIEVRYKTPGDTRNARIPDVAFSSAKRPIITKGSVPELPDLAVEVKSPDDSLKDLREKARYFIANGTKMFIITLPAKRLLEVYTPNDEYVLDVNDTLDGGEALPGFTMPVADVFKDPLEEP
jgi:Uma2 family endonuclease